MKFTHRLVVLLCCMAAYLTHYGAKVQFIHNALSENVDIYIDDRLQFQNLIFRQGTPFIDFPEGYWTMKVAPANSGSVEESVADFDFYIDSASTYIVMLGGETNAYELFTHEAHSLWSDANQHAGMTFVHGAIGIPRINLSSQEQNVIEGLHYGEFTNFLNIPSSQFSLITETHEEEVPLIANYVKLDFWKKKSVVFFSSGYTDGRLPRLRTYAILFNGTSFPLEEIPLPDNHKKVNVQLIQNVPAAAFDLYLNDELLIDDFDFRTATPFLDFPKEEYFNIGLAPANSTSYLEVTEYFTFKLDKELPYLLFIHHDETEGNTLMQLRDRVPESTIASSVAVSFAHGVFDMSSVDIYVDGVRKYSNVGAGEITPHLLLPSRPFQLDLHLANEEQSLFSYDVNLSHWRGRSAAIYTSGFAENENFPLSMQVTLSDSSTFALTPKTANVDEEGDEEVIEARGVLEDNPTQVFVEKKTIDVIVRIDEPNALEIRLVDGAGKVIEEQIEGQLGKGKYFFDIRKKYLPAGIYFLQIWIGEEQFKHQVLVGR
ncbi:MAG: DUF4397 domain-containing protein [Bacteroidota bacterium]